MSAFRPRCVPFEPTYPTSTPVPAATSRSMVKFQLCRYGEGAFTSYPLDPVTPVTLASAAGKGFESVTRFGFVVDPVNVCVSEKGKPPVRSVRIALNLEPV